MKTKPPRYLVSPRKDFRVDHSSLSVRVGHRGARGYAPENTLIAFKKASEMGCQMIELDVHMSRDGYPIVFHDDTLLRCTDVGVKFPGRAKDFLSNFTLAELKTLDAGSWYACELLLEAEERQGFLKSLQEREIRAHISADELDHFKSGQVTIPTLEEALSFCLDLNLVINIEVKTIPRMYENLTSSVCEIIHKMNAHHHVLISSFDHRQLQIVRTISDQICTGILTSNRMVNIDRYMDLLDVDAFHPGCSGDSDTLGFGSATGSFDPTDLHQAKSNSKMTFVWTCNSSQHATKLRNQCVTGIITDYPNRI